SWYQYRCAEHAPAAADCTCPPVLPGRRATQAKRLRPALGLLVLGAASGLFWPFSWTGAAEQTLWGYGVRSCPQYLAAVAAADAGDAAELQRYEDWLTGFVSALNLALGEDVLRGSDLTDALRETRRYCREHDDADFFNAAMDHVRALSGER
ncbi:MAG: hypothetical protein PVG09_03355, partial [Thiohalocapsa sp.]